MVNKVLISPAFEKGHLNGLVDEGRYLQQSSLYRQILPRPVRRSFSEGGTPSRPKTSGTSVAKNLFNLRNPWLINDLRLFKALYISSGSSTDAESSLQIHLFLTNKANFQKSQMNVTDLLTKDYGKMDTWSSGKNKANSKPIQTQYKANSKPIQTQYKPKQTQPVVSLPNIFQRQKMLYFTINPWCQSLGYYPGMRFRQANSGKATREFLANYEVKLDYYINDVYNAGFI